MDYKIVVDSCGELTDEMKKSGLYESIALSLLVEDETILDDESFDQADFLLKVAGSPESPKSSCPSPDRYMKSYCCDADRIYVVTLSSQLSGSFSSAELGKKLYEEEYGDKDIYVFNSCSASIGETLIALKIQECEERRMDFDQVISTVEDYIKEQHTYFVLESLDTLRKNGRLTGIKSFVASALNIKPVMGSTPAGTIYQIGQARGIKRALAKMVEQVIAEVSNAEGKILAISHCNCKERALDVRRMLLDKLRVKDCIVVETAGISTMYANDGGVIVAI